MCQQRQQQTNHQDRPTNIPQTLGTASFRARRTLLHPASRIRPAAVAPSSNVDAAAEGGGAKAAPDVLLVLTSDSVLEAPIFPQRSVSFSLCVSRRSSSPSPSSRPPDFPRLPQTSRHSWMKVKHALTYLSPIGYCVIYSSLSIIPTFLICVLIRIPTSTVLLPV